MAYAKLEPTGCGVFKGKIQLRISMYLELGDYGYERHHVQLPVIPSGGYPGPVSKSGEPLDMTDYETWLAGLPKVWQNNPFHNHFIFVDSQTTDQDIRLKVVEAFNHFRQVWNDGKDILQEWGKLPEGRIKEPFVKGNEPAKVCSDRLQTVLSKAKDFEVKL